MIEACLLHQGTEFCSYLRRRFFSPLNRGFAQGWPLPNGPEKEEKNLVKSQQILTYYDIHSFEYESHEHVILTSHGLATDFYIFLLLERPLLTILEIGTK